MVIRIKFIGFNRSGSRVLELTKSWYVRKYILCYKISWTGRDESGISDESKLEILVPW
jgi:hypothetical protein